MIQNWKNLLDDYYSREADEVDEESADEDEKNNPYLQERDRNIARNIEFLNNLGLGSHQRKSP